MLHRLGDRRGAAAPRRVLGPVSSDFVRRHPEVLEELRAVLLEAGMRPPDAPPRRPPGRWAVVPTHAGLEWAQLVVVNVRDDDERARAERLVAGLLRLRNDDELFDDVLGFRGTRIPITALVANVEDAMDKGLGKAVARVKRTIQGV